VYLFDTDILIYHFNSEIPEKSKDEIRRILKSHFNISVISKMEFLGFRKHSEHSFVKAKIFIDYARVFQLEEGIVEMVIDLRRNYKIKLPDAIICSTALLNDFILVTRNTEDYQQTGIKIYNPFE